MTEQKQLGNIAEREDPVVQLIGDKVQVGRAEEQPVKDDKEILADFMDESKVLEERDTSAMAEMGKPMDYSDKATADFRTSYKTSEEKGEKWVKIEFCAAFTIGPYD